MGAWSAGTPTFAVVVPLLVLLAGNETGLEESTPRPVGHVTGETMGIPRVSPSNVWPRN